MAVRIRVYPQTGAFGAMGMRGYGGAVSAQTHFSSRLQAQRQVSNLQLGYERALANERIERARLEERMRNPYALMGAGFGGGLLPGAGAYNPWAASLMGSSLLGGQQFFAGLGLGGML
jgi:hypothetical protein